MKGKALLKSFAILLAAVIAFGFIAPVFAGSDIDGYYDDLDIINERIKERKKERDQANAELTRLRGLLDKLDQDMNVVDKDLESLGKKITEMEMLISAQEDLIAAVEASIAETEGYLEQQIEYLEQRLCAMYKNGAVSYLEVLFSASSFSDFISRFSFIRLLVESDAELVAEIEATKVQLQADKDLLDNELDLLVQRTVELEADKAKVEEQKAVLDAQSLEYERVAVAVKAELSKLNKGISSDEDEAKKIEAQIKKSLELERVLAGDPPSFFTWPVEGFDRIPYNITSEFGWRHHPITKVWSYHSGVDIARLNREGESIGGKPILAAASGTVEFVRSYDGGGYGIYAIISHGGGYQTLYAHMRQVIVKAGDKVEMGQKIGVVGTTGSSTGNHLHFEVWVMGEKKDALKFEYK